MDAFQHKTSNVKKRVSDLKEPESRWKYNSAATSSSDLLSLYNAKTNQKILKGSLKRSVSDLNLKSPRPTLPTVRPKSAMNISRTTNQHSRDHRLPKKKMRRRPKTAIRRRNSSASLFATRPQTAGPIRRNPSQKSTWRTKSLRRTQSARVFNYSAYSTNCYEDRMLVERLNLAREVNTILRKREEKLKFGRKKFCGTPTQCDVTRYAALPKWIDKRMDLKAHEVRGPWTKLRQAMSRPALFALNGPAKFPVIHPLDILRVKMMCLSPKMSKYNPWICGLRSFKEYRSLAERAESDENESDQKADNTVLSGDNVLDDAFLEPGALLSAFVHGAEI